jgi:hypothetical protein
LFQPSPSSSFALLLAGLNYRRFRFLDTFACCRRCFALYLRLRVPGALSMFPRRFSPSTTPLSAAAETSAIVASVSGISFMVHPSRLNC